MVRGRAAVMVSLVPVVVVELYGIRHPGRGFTVSELVRAAFRTDTSCGRAAFVAATAGAASWFVPHIISKAADASSASS